MFQVVNFKKPWDLIEWPFTHTLSFSPPTLPETWWPKSGGGWYVTTKFSKKHLIGSGFRALPVTNWNTFFLLFFTDLMRHFPITILHSSLLRRGIRRRGASFFCWEKGCSVCSFFKTHQRTKETSNKNKWILATSKIWQSLGICKNLTKTHLLHWFCHDIILTYM